MGGGLYHAYAKQTCVNNPKDYYQKQTEKPKHVLVVGAGMAGLSAAYELRQTGHKVGVLDVYLVEVACLHDDTSVKKLIQELTHMVKYYGLWVSSSS